MFFKPRPVPADIIILRALNNRMNLIEKDKKYFIIREKGYAGEVMFDKLTEKLLLSNCYILNDLLLEFNNTEFQIDSSIIIQDTINIFEVKNYEREYYFESDKFYTNAGKLINNPLDQLKRTESLLRQYLQSIGCPFAVEGYVVFVNPEFTLLQAPRDKPIILPTQLNHFFKKFNLKPSKLNGEHLKLANQLLYDHKTKSRNSLLPVYQYGQLKKGIFCAVCDSFFVSVGERKMVCLDCGTEEDVDAAVIRTVEELKLLFSTIEITTSLVQDWCRVIDSKKTIRRVLSKNYKVYRNGKFLFFE